MIRNELAWQEYINNKIKDLRQGNLVKKEDVETASFLLNKLNENISELEEPEIQIYNMNLVIVFYDRKFNIPKKQDSKKLYILAKFEVYGKSILIKRSDKSEKIMKGEYNSTDRGWGFRNESILNVKEWDLYRSESYKLLYKYSKGIDLPQITNYQYMESGKDAKESFEGIKDFEMPTLGILKKLKEGISIEITKPEIKDRGSKRIIEWKFPDNNELRILIKKSGIKIKIKEGNRISKGGASSVITLTATKIWNEVLNFFENAMEPEKKIKENESIPEYIKNTIDSMKQWNVPSPSKILEPASKHGWRLIWKYGKSEFYILLFSTNSEKVGWYKSSISVPMSSGKHFNNVKEFLNSNIFLSWVEDVVEMKQLVPYRIVENRKRRKKAKSSASELPLENIENMISSDIVIEDKRNDISWTDTAVKISKILLEDESVSKTVFAKTLKIFNEVILEKEGNVNLISKIFEE